MDEAQWFYMDKNQRRGPLTTAELVGALWILNDPRSALVWRQGMSAWQAAGEISELATRLPPPIPTPRSSAADGTQSAEPPPAFRPGESASVANQNRAPSFGRIYAWSTLAWSGVSAMGACLKFIETKRPLGVVFLDFVGAVVGVLLLFAPVTALLVWAAMKAFRKP